MGSHRAEKPSRRRPATPRDVATPDAPSGPRRIVASGSTRRPAPETPALPRDPAPAVQVAARAAAGSGRRRADTPVKTTFLARVPAVPTLVGMTALLVAAAGAVTFEDDLGTTHSQFQLSAEAHALSGTDAVGFAGNARQMALSRDSERQALQDAADARLLAAAEQQAAERNAELRQLGKAAEARATEIAKNQWHLPASGYHLTARFGMAGGLWSSNHTGLDFAAPTGTPIMAVANGVIVSTGYEGAYGNQTVERLEDGTEIWYCHQNQIDVEPGDTVTGGQQIGEIGSTGNTTGPHLHLEVRPGGGDPVDPFQALVFHGITP